MLSLKAFYIVKDGLQCKASEGFKYESSESDETFPNFQGDLLTLPESSDKETFLPSISKVREWS